MVQPSRFGAAPQGERKGNPVETQSFDQGIDALLHDPMTLAAMRADRLHPATFRATLSAAAARLRNERGLSPAAPPRVADAALTPPEAYVCRLALSNVRTSCCGAPGT